MRIDTDQLIGGALDDVEICILGGAAENEDGNRRVGVDGGLGDVERDEQMIGDAVGEFTRYGLVDDEQNSIGLFVGDPVFDELNRRLTLVLVQEDCLAGDFQKVDAVLGDRIQVVS